MMTSSGKKKKGTVTKNRVHEIALFGAFPGEETPRLCLKIYEDQ